jgi:hypothetical protein
MADETPRRRPRTLFVGLSIQEFNARVRSLAEHYFEIVDVVPPTGTPAGLLLKGPGVIPHEAVIIAFSPTGSSELPLAKTISEVVNAFPESEYYFVFPDDQPQDPMEPFIDKVLDGRVPGRAVVSLRNFVSAFEDSVGELSGHAAGGASAHAFAGGGDIPGKIPNDELFITFDQSLSADQIKATLTAFAAYYRACGGVGLPAEFESQEAAVLEDARV